MKRILAAIAATLCCLVAQAQITKDLDFIDYLLGNNLSKDALAWIQHKDYAPSDTLDYMKGLTFYTAGKLDLAAAEFEKVPGTSPYYDKSLLLGAVSYAYTGGYDSGLRLISAYPDSELKSYGQAAFSLLTDDKAGYELASKNFTYTDYSLAEGEKIFGNIYQSRFVDKQKSPALAAAMSAVLPGAGKWYAGRKDEGIVSLITVGVFAGITAENWIKKGPKDWRTIVFGTLGSLFYIGNIYGSYVSVGIYNDNLRNAQNSTIVFNLHVPVRSRL